MALIEVSRVKLFGLGVLDAFHLSPRKWGVDDSPNSPAKMQEKPANHNIFTFGLQGVLLHNSFRRFAGNTANPKTFRWAQRVQPYVRENVGQILAFARGGVLNPDTTVSYVAPLG